jgi:hypothetical protein
VRDKVVIMLDYAGLRPGNLVRFIRDDLTSKKGDVGLVLDTCLIPRSLGEGEHEIYDPMLVIITRNKRICVSVDSVRKIEDE